MSKSAHALGVGRLFFIHNFPCQLGRCHSLFFYFYEEMPVMKKDEGQGTESFFSRPSERRESFLIRMLLYRGRARDTRFEKGCTAIK